MKNRTYLFSAIIGYSFLNNSAIVAAPITFNTALPVAKEEFVFRGQYVRIQSDDDPSGAGRDRTENQLVTALGYGLSGKWALFGVVPYRDIKLTSNTSAQRSQTGIGDMRAFVRYTAHQENEKGRTFRVAPCSGMKMPTGEDNARDAQGVLPASVQLGSGSWDAFGGVILTWQTLNYQFDTQFSYQANNETNGVEAGDITRLDLSYQHRLLPRTLAGGVPDYLYGVIETNGIYKARNKVNGAEDANSGGTQIFISPGLQYVSKRWMVEALIQIPVTQNLHGTALESDTIIRTSVRFNF